MKWDKRVSDGLVLNTAALALLAALKKKALKRRKERTAKKSL